MPAYRRARARAFAVIFVTNIAHPDHVAGIRVGQLCNIIWIVRTARESLSLFSLFSLLYNIRAGGELNYRANYEETRAQYARDLRARIELIARQAYTRIASK